MSKLNTNSNAYIIIYSAVLVVVVAFLLAFVFKALKPMQDANVALDVKKQILYSLNLRDSIGSDEQAEALYGRVITRVDSIGEGKERKPYIYYAELGGEPKYVFPLTGMGLWGSISGFLSVCADKNTVYGAYFNHESETAGLGAEIKDSRQWQEKFHNLKIFNDDRTKIELAVVKNVEDEVHQVDAVTGATLTSNGVSDMLQACLSGYIGFLTEE